MANYPLRLPESVRKAAELAADGVSLNQFFATAIAEKAAMLTAVRVMDERAARADRGKFDEVMRRVGKQPHREGDEVPPTR
jgi:energy-coupling factor transporter ATP-binding protein EcfA2